MVHTGDDIEARKGIINEGLHALCIYHTAAALTLHS